jgi:hypothetical protein
MILQNGMVTNFTYMLSIGGALCALIFFFTSFTLKTQINVTGIYVRYSPFQASFISYSFEDIQDLYIRKFNALNEYNGWGIKWGAMGKSYTVTTNNTGIQLILKSGERVLIGTQQAKQIIAAFTRLGMQIRFEN